MQEITTVKLVGNVIKIRSMRITARQACIRDFIPAFQQEQRPEELPGRSETDDDQYLEIIQSTQLGEDSMRDLMILQTDERKRPSGYVHSKF